MKRVKTTSVLIEDTGLDAEGEIQAAELIRTEYNRSAVAACVEEWLGDRGICYSKDIGLLNDKSYIMSMLAVLTGRDSDAGYVELEGNFTENEYTIPQLRIMRKEKSK